MSDKERGCRSLWWIVAPAMPLLLLGVMTPVLFPRPCPVTREALGRIEAGMTHADVEAILGGPPGDYRTVLVEPYIGSGGGVSWEMCQGDEVEVWIGFEGSVVSSRMEHPKDVSKIGIGDIIRWRLGL